MLQNNTIAELLTEYFNAESEDVKHKFHIYDGAGDYNLHPECTQGTLTLISGNNKPIMNYINTTCQYCLSFNQTIQFGLISIYNVNKIITNVIKRLNGIPIYIDEGQAILTFKSPSVSDLAVRAAIGQSVISKLVFDVEYSVIHNNGLRYEMSLCSNQFMDENSINERYFKTEGGKTAQQIQKEWYDNLIATNGVPFSPTMTPIINGVLIQQQMYINDIKNYPNNTTRVTDINDILAMNCAVIRVMKGKDEIKRWYCSATPVGTSSNNQATFRLKINTIQTHYFDPNINIAPCLINRAHLNRFLVTGTGTSQRYYYNTSPNSPFFEQETENCPKYLRKRTRLNVNNTNIVSIDEWLDKNVAYWVYVFCDSNSEGDYTVSNVNGSGSTGVFRDFSIVKYGLKTDSDYYYAAYGCIAYPIYKTKARIHCRRNPNVENSSNRIVILDKEGFNFFKKQNNNSSYVYNIKFSFISPLYFPNQISSLIDANGNLQIDDSDIVVYNGALNYDNFKVIQSFSDGSQHSAGCIYGFIQRPYADSKYYYLDTKASFTKSELQGNRVAFCNPKFLGTNFKELVLKSYTADSFIYDIMKMRLTSNDESIHFRYTEPLMPDITRYYARLKNEESDLSQGFYNINTMKNYLGLVGSLDNAVSFSNDQLSAFYANQRNFWLQASVNTAVDTGISIASRNYSGIINTGAEMVNKVFMLDNLKGAPSTLRQANGNVILNSQVDQIGLFVEENEAFEQDKKVYDDLFFMNGNKYNRVGNVKDSDNIRHYFNYVQADVESIGGISISNESRNDIRQRFSAGVRFWNVDNIDYSKENYENFISV